MILSELLPAFDQDKLPPLVAAGIPRDLVNFRMSGSDIRSSALRGVGRQSGSPLRFQETDEPRHDFLSFAEPVFEAVDTLGEESVVSFRE